MSEWSISDKLASIERELRLRHRVYPRRIADGHMTADQARREIEIMEAIRDDYRRRRSDLFAPERQLHE
jgi:hypothetical protein